MRTLNIPTSQAAKDRLAWLVNPADLALPLDRESLRPFDFAFRKDVLCVTFEGVDVAFVPDIMSGPKSFNLHVALDPSPTADAALQRFFATLNRHLTTVARMKKEEKQHHKDTQEEREIRARTEKERAIAEDIMDAARFFVPASTVFPPEMQVSAEDFQEAFKFTSPDDLFKRRGTYGHEIILNTPKDMRVIFNFEAFGTEAYTSHKYSYGDGTVIFEKFARDGLVFDQRLFHQEITRMRERAARISGDDQVRTFIEGLPAPEYRIESFLLRTDSIMRSFDTTFGDIRVVGDDMSIEFLQEGCVTDRFRASPVYGGNFPKTPADALHHMGVNGDRADLSHAAARVGSFMIAQLAHTNPDMDMDVYKKVNIDDLDAEALKFDTGYGF